MANKGTLISEINDLLESTVSSEAGKKEEVKKKVEELGKLIPDTRVYRVIALTLGIAVLLGVVGIAMLAGLGKTVPDALTALASAGVGALAGAITIK